MADALTREIIISTTLATLFVTVGLLALLAGLSWRHTRVSALLLSYAMFQHCISVTAGSPGLRLALGGSPRGWMWASAITGYFIAVPWALLVEQAAGRGWRASIRRTWQAYIVCAVAAIAVDVAAGRPGSAAATIRAVVAAGALVGFANVTFGPLRRNVELRPLRYGYMVFLALVIQDYLSAILAPTWPHRIGELGLLVFLGSLAYTVIQGSVARERRLQAISQELETARRIQTSLLPSSAPRVDGAVIAFRQIPAAAVGGDLFQFIGVGPRRVGILVADVSGHGVPAALIASMVKVAAAAQSGHAEHPALVLAGIHQAVAHELPGGQFVTAVYVHADLETGMLRHASAGHPPAIIGRRGDPNPAPAGGTGPLVIEFAPPEYPVSEVALRAGDRVVLYTDGVIETMRSDGEMFGVERLSALVGAISSEPEAFVSGVMTRLSDFSSRDGGFDDDCTLVTLDVLGQG